MTDGGFMGPPWQMDWTLKAQAARDALPERVRKMVDAARAELVTAKDPYFRGRGLLAVTEGHWRRPVRPAHRST
ncbi:hypothetical protein [Streptomyces sp. NPDC057363]|uniref:hypothetical protein n=1 Tax=Streptomyces sp. NPDC057363 TaxID=3346107 RepID=UPI00362D4F3B